MCRFLKLVFIFIRSQTIAVCHKGLQIDSIHACSSGQVLYQTVIIAAYHLFGSFLEGCICRYRFQNISFQLCFLLALGRAHQVIVNVLTIFFYCAYAVNIAGCHEIIVQNRVRFFINMIYRYREYNVCTGKVCIAVILREGKV